MRTFAAIAIFLVLATGTALAQPSRFTYQGSLKTNGQPANGNFDMQFDLFSSVSGNTSLASRTVLNVAVVNGTFNVILDFGYDQFTGATRFMEVAVRPAGSGTYTPLAPRTEMTTSPFAIQSVNSVNAAQAFNSQRVGGLLPTDFAQTTDPRLSDARTPLPNSPSYIQNGSTAQNATSFNISGNGTVGGVFSANQFNIGADRLIKTDQWNTLTMGIESGDVSTTGGAFNNAFFGFRAGKVNQGYANSFFGAFAGERNNGGLQNSFFGAGAGFSNVNGSDNTLFGFDAGRNDLDTTPTGSRNTIMGSGAGNRVVGGDNTFVGYRAGRSDGLGTGTANTLIGASTSNFRGQGSYNTFIGYGTGTINSSLDYATAIGAGAVVSTGSTVQLGRATGDDTVLVPGRLVVKNGGLTILENGNVGIGLPNPAFKLDVAGRMQVKQPSGSTGATNSAGIYFYQNTPATERAFVGMETDSSVGFFGVNGGGWSLVMDTGTGRVKIVQLGSAGSTQLCRNASNEISTCSSSIRYKDNVQNFRPGLDLIKKLRPVSFDWKADGKADLGLVAEEVAAAEPLLASTNEKGEVEGVKYDRVGVVLVNAVNEQQTQIESLEKKVEEQNELLKTQKAEIDALKQFICTQNPTAAFCAAKP